MTSILDILLSIGISADVSKYIVIPYLYHTNKNYNQCVKALKRKFYYQRYENDEYQNHKSINNYFDNEYWEWIIMILNYSKIYE